VTTTALVWFGLLGGMTAWAAHLVLSYAIVGVGCGQLGEPMPRALLVAVTVGTGLIAVASFLAARLSFARSTAWRRSLSRAGVLLDGLGIFGIAVAGTLPFALSAC
jgi:hypothetical protein